MADTDKQKVPAGSGDGLDAAVKLISLIGGQRGTTTTSATSNAGDITALQDALAQLKAEDYSALLEGIFQQAGAQIPGLRNAYTSSIGARGRNNSAMAAAMQELLKATTVQAYDRIAQSKLANQQAQVQAGQAIANATKGTQTTQTQTQKSGLDLQRAAALLALWQGIGQLTSGKKPSDMFGGLFGGGGTTTSAPAAPTVVAPAAAAPVASAAPLSAPAMSSDSRSFALPNILTKPIGALGNLIAYGSTERPVMMGSTPSPITEMFAGIQPSTSESLGITEPAQMSPILDFQSALQEAMMPSPAPAYEPTSFEQAYNY